MPTISVRRRLVPYFDHIRSDEKRKSYGALTRRVNGSWFNIPKSQLTAPPELYKRKINANLSEIFIRFELTEFIYEKIYFTIKTMHTDNIIIHHESKSNRDRKL